MPDPLSIVSLGGSGGFGMNGLLLHASEGAILVDFGVGFPHPGLPGVDRLCPDPAPLTGAVPRLDAVLLTHGHDDHVGGLPWLPAPWRTAPLYGTALTVAMARDRCEDGGADDLDLRTVASGATVTAGPWSARFVNVTHSIPESCALVIEGPGGRIVHTGDFKLEREPVLGPATDVAALGAAASAGVDLLLVDSTGALRPGRSRGEREVAPELRAAARGADGQLFVSIFSSHLHRLATILETARVSGRRAALLGRRLTRAYRHARELGILGADAGTVVSADQLAAAPPMERLWITAGCQAEATAALSRLSHGQDTRAAVAAGDTVVVSASIIPGNERPVAHLRDRLLRLGARVVHAADGGALHASGHASREEIAELVDLVRPASVMPLHGERRHLEEVAAIAAPRVAGDVVVAERGETVRLRGGALSRGDDVELPPLWLDAEGRAVTLEAIRRRRRMAGAGVVVVHLVRDARGGRWEVGDAEARGVAGWSGGGGRREAALSAARDALAGRGRGPLDDALAGTIERRVGRALAADRRMRPEVVVVPSLERGARA